MSKKGAIYPYFSVWNVGFLAPWRFPAYALLAFEIVKVLLIWDAGAKGKARSS